MVSSEDELNHTEWEEAELDDRERQLDAEIAVLDQQIKQLREERFQAVLALEIVDAQIRAIERVTGSSPGTWREEAGR